MWYKVLKRKSISYSVRGESGSHSPKDRGGKGTFLMAGAWSRWGSVPGEEGRQRPVTWRNWSERQAFWSGTQPLGKDLRTALGDARIRECHRRVGKLAFPLPCVWEKTSYCTESRVHSYLNWEPKKNTFERQCQKTQCLNKFLVTSWKHVLETTRGSQHLLRLCLQEWAVSTALGAKFKGNRNHEVCYLNAIGKGVQMRAGYLTGNKRHKVWIKAEVFHQIFFLLQTFR